MCNACGFMCCAYDGFSGCGCDHCDEPECWSAEALDEEFGDDADDYHYCDHEPSPQPRSDKEGG